MLKNKQGKSESQPWQEVLPWVDLITPGLMLCKDGSVLAGYEYYALDADNLEPELINACTNQIHRAFNTFDTRFSAWVVVTKVRDKSYPEQSFTNPVSAELDDIVKQRFLKGDCYSIVHRIYISYTGNTGVSKYMDTVSTLMNDHGSSMPMAMLKALNPINSSKNAALHDDRQLDANTQAMEAALKTFEGVLSSFKFKRLMDWDLETALVLEANITIAPTTKFKKPPAKLFDGWCSQSQVTIGREQIKVSGITEHKFVGQLVVNEYPEELSSMMLENLLVDGGEIKICHAIRFLDHEAAQKEIESGLDYYHLTQFSLISRAMSKFNGTPMVPRPGKQDLYLQCLEAKRRQMSENLGFVMHALTVSVYGDSVRDCESNIADAARSFSKFGFSVIRERLNLGPSFAAMLPGQWATQIRLNLQNSEAVSDCMPIYTIDPGSKKHEYFSEEVYKYEVPAFSVFRNVYGGKANFSPHEKQVGHMLIIAPTGGGKTTFVNFQLSQFLRYPNARLVIFDRDYSCRITTELHNGTHMDMRMGQMRCNPFSTLRDGSTDGLIWCREFLIRRLFEGGYETNADDRRAIDEALSRMQSSKQSISLSVIATQLPIRLKEQLSEWFVGRPYGMFDSTEDDFALSNWTCIEMKEIMANERLARAFLDYAFRKISVSLDGNPTFIYLEEASFLLNHEKFAEMIDDWLKTLRKKNAFLWMTIQSPASVTNSKISATLLDNVKSIMVLSNNKVEAHRGAYKTNFGMTDGQVDMVKVLIPALEYMHIKNGIVRKYRTLFDTKSLAYLRSEISLQKQFDVVKATKDPSWKKNYLNQITRSNP